MVIMSIYLFPNNKLPLCSMTQENQVFLSYHLMHRSYHHGNTTHGLLVLHTWRIWEQEVNDAHLEQRCFCWNDWFMVYSLQLNMRLKELFNTKITKEMARVKWIEIIIETFCVTRLSKWEIFVISKLAKILADYVLEIVKHCSDCLYLVWINIRGFLLSFFHNIISFVLRYLIFFLYYVELLFKLRFEFILHTFHC